MSKITPKSRVRLRRSQMAALFSLFGVFVLLVTSVFLYAYTRAGYAVSANNTVNFQARLETNTGAIAPDGNYNVEFKLYDASTGGTNLWTETRTGANKVRVQNGYLTVNLGSVTAFPSNMNWAQQLYLTMNIGGTGSTATYDGEMNPRLLLTATPYAFTASSLSSVNPVTGFKSSLSFQGATGGDQTFNIPNLGSNGNDVVCLQSLANCTGTGGGIAGTGTQYYLSYFDTAGGNHIASLSSGAAALYNNGSFLGLGTSTNNGLLSIVGSNAAQSNVFVQSAANATSPSIVVQQASGQTGDLFQFQDNAGTVNGSINASGNQLTLGRTATTGTVSQGKIVLADGTTSGYNLTLQTGALTGATGNLTVNFPVPGSGTTSAEVCYRNDPSCGFSVTGGGGSFINNQTTQQPNANFNISGTGVASSFAAATFDTASAATLNLGTTNASGINIGQSGVTTTINGPLQGSVANFTGANAVTLGSSSNVGTLRFSDGTNDGFYGKLQLAGAITADQTYLLPTTGGTLLTTASANGLYIQNSTTQSTGNFNITGTGVAGILQAGTFDTATAQALAIGSTNATQINLNQSTTLASNKNLNFQAGSGNFDQSASTGTFATGTGTVTLNGATTAQAGIAISGTGSLATQAGSDYTVTGAQTDVNLGSASLIRLNGTSAQTLNSIAGGVNGRILTIVNAGNNVAVIKNNGAGTVSNKVVTGTGSDISLPSGASITLIYDATASVWRVNGGVATTAAAGVNTVGPISSTSNANGATISGTTLNLTAADGTNGGVVSNTTQTFAGAKTFAALLTGNAGLNITGATALSGAFTQSGGTFSLQGNAASSITTTAGNLSLDSAATLQLGTANATGVTIGRSGVTTTIQGSTAVTLSATTGTALVCQNAGSLLSTCDSSYLAPTSGNFIQNQNASAQTGTVYLQSGAAATVPTIQVKAASGQSGALFYGYTSTGGLAAIISASGSIFNSGTFGTSAQNAASTNSLGASFLSGNTSGATSNTGNVVIKSGDSTTSGNTGNVIVDSGAATSGTNGTVNVGNTNASAITIGRTGITTNVNGNLGINNNSGANPFAVNSLTTAAANYQAAIGTNGTGNNGLVIQGVASQSGTSNLINVQSSTGATYFQVSGTGQVQASNFAISSGTAGYAKNYTAGTGGISANDVVVFANDGGNGRVVDSNTAYDTRVAGVALSSTASGSTATIVISGTASVKYTGTAPAIGDQLVVSATSGNVQVDNNATQGILGYAIAVGNGTTVVVRLQVHGGQATPVFQGNVTVASLQNTGNSFNVASNGALTATTGTFTSNVGVTGTITASGAITSGNSGTAGSIVVYANGVASTIVGSASSAATLTLPSTTGTLALTSDSTNFIRNQTGQQANSNFNIDGTGIANILQATSTIRVNNTTSSNPLAVGTVTTTNGTTTNAQVLVSTGGAANSGVVIQSVAGQSAGSYGVAILNATGSLTGGITSGGNFIANGGNVSTFDQSGAGFNSTAINFRSGNATGTGANSGNVNVDSGTATGTTGIVNVGTTNASGVTVGRSTTTTTIQGTTSFTTLQNTNNSFNVNSSGNLTANNGSYTGNVSIAGSLATKKGTDFATTGSTDSANFGATSLVRLTGASAQTIVGIANGSDGYRLTIVNAAAQAAIIKNSASATAANNIVTGTGGDVSLPAGASLELIYDSGASVWRVTSGVAASGGAGVNTVGTLDGGAANANGASISGTTVYLQSASSSFAGLVNTTAQTFAGAKTFSSLLTASAGLTSSGGAISLQGNAASSLTTTAGNLTVDSAAALQLGNTNATSIALGHSGITTTLTGTLAVSGNQTITAASGTVGLVVQGANLQNIATFANSGGTTVASFDLNGKLTAAGGTFNGVITANSSTIENISIGTDFNQHTNSVTNTNTTSTSATTNAQLINLTGTANTNGTNNLVGTRYSNVTAVTGNNFYGISFGTGYNDILRYNGTQLISGTGTFQNAGFGTSVNYSNITQVGALTSGSIASGFGTISTTNTIGTTAAITTGNASNAGAINIFSNGFASSIVGNSATGSAQTFTLPANGGTLALTNDTTNFIRNQTGQQASSNFNISGTGVAATSLQAPLFDTNAATALAIGTTNATQINLNQNTVIASGKTLTVTNGATTLGGSLATKKGTDFATTGSTDSANFGATSLVRLTGASAQTIVGIANGSDGYRLTIINAGSTTATIKNNASGTAANNVITGTGADVSLPVGASLELIYDAGANVWRVAGAVAANGGYSNGVTTVGSLNGGTANANGATISGSNIFLQSASSSFAGLVDTATQTFAGTKTFSSLLTANSGLTTSGTVTVGGLGAGLVQASSGGVLSSGTADRNSSTFFSGTLSVANGGTGATSLTSNGILYGNGTGAAQATAAGTGGQLLLANASGVPVFTTLSGDINTVSNTGAVTVGGVRGQNFSFTSLTSGDVLQYNGTNVVNGKITNSNFAANTQLGNITGVGALTSGSITSGFGTISTTNTISTTAAITGGSINTSGAVTSGNSSTAGSIVVYSNGVASTIVGNSATASAQTFTLPANGGTLLTTATANSNYIQNNPGSQQTGSSFNIAAGSGVVAATIQGASGQDIADFKSSGGATVASVDQNGKLTGIGVNAGSGQIAGTGGLSVTGASTFGGSISQTVSSGVSGAATLQNVTATNTSSTNSTNIAQAINLTGTANTNGTNSLVGVNFYGVSAATGNTFTGLNFADSSYNNILKVGSTQIINGAGVLQNAGISSSVNYSNLTQVGALVSGSIASGFGTISTNNTITGTTINGTTGINTGSGAGTQRIDVNGNLVNIGDITTGNAYITSLTRTLPNTVGTEVDLGSFNLSSGSGAFTATVTVPANNFSVSKTYNFGVGFNQTNNTWTIVQPTSDSGNFAGNDFTLEANSYGTNFSLRLRRTANSGFSGVAYIVLEHDGLTSDAFTPSTATAAVTAPTTYFSSAIFGQSGGTATAQGNVAIANSGTLSVGGNTVFNASGLLQSNAFNGNYTSQVTINNSANVFGGTSATLSSTVQGGSFQNTNSSFTVSGTGVVKLALDSTAGSTVVCQNASGNLSSCSTTYAPATGGNYIAKNTNDTSSASYAGNLLALSNTNTGAAGVLALTNSGTNSTLNITATGNPTSGQALIVANNNATTPSGNLINLQNKGVSKYSVDVSGNENVAGNITLGGAIVAGGTITGLTGITSSGAINFTGLNSVGLVQTNASGTLSTGVLDRNSSTYLSGTLSVANGGTGLTSFANANGVLVGNGTTISQTNAPTSGQLLLSNGTTPTFTTLSGDATINASGALTIANGAITSAKILDGTIANADLSTGTFSNITGVGALNAGSIGTGFGTISTGNNITTTAALQGGSLTVTGTASFNSTSTFTGVATFNGGIVNTGSSVFSAVTLTSYSSSQTLPAATTVDVATTIIIPENTDGLTLTLPDPTNATASGRIVYVINTGSKPFTMQGVSITAGHAQTYVYDGNHNWTPTNIDGAGSGATFVGGIDSVGASVNGATITGNGLYLQTADGASGGRVGLVSTGTQSFAGNKTFNGSISSGSSITATGAISGQSFQNSANNFQVSAAGLVTFVASTTNDTSNVVCRNSLGQLAGCSTGFQAAGNYLVQTPTSTATNTISPATSGVVGLTVNATNTGTAAAAAIFNQSQNAAGVQINNSGTGSSLLVTSTANAGSGSALIVANNNASAPSGNLIDLQNKATSKFSVDVSGNIAATGNITGLVNVAASGTIKFTSFGAGIVQSDASGNITSSSLNLGTTTYLTGNLPVGNGGTGTNTLTSKGILFGNGTGAIQATSAAANSVLVTDGSNNPSLSTTLPSAVQANITGLGTVTSGSITSFGTIATGNTISGTTITGTTGINTGSTQRIDANGNLVNIGQITQSYSSNTNNSSANSLSVTNSNNTATATTVNGQTINLTGTASGANTINGLNLANVTAVSGNTFNGIAIGTNYTNALTVGGVSIINGAGVLQSAGLVGSYTGSVQFNNAASTFTGLSGTFSNAVQGGSFNNTGSTFTVSGAGIVKLALNSSTTGANLVCQNTNNELATCTNTYAQTNDTTNFIRNNATATAQSTASFNIDGKGVAAQLQAPIFDTATGVQLNLGATNASAVAIGRSSITTTITGTLAVAGNQTITTNSSTATGLVINQQGSANILVLQSNGTAKVTVDNGGNLSTSANITLTNAANFSMNGGTGTFATGSGSVSLQGPTSVTGTNTFTVGTGLTSLGGGLAVTAGNVDVTNSLALKAGTDYSGAGGSVSFGNTSLVRLTGGSAQTINNILEGRNGAFLTIVNAGSQAATIANNSTAAGYYPIVTGTGSALTLPAGASISMVFDSGASLWRVTGSVAAQGGYSNGVTTIGALQTTPTNTNGASISGTNLYLQSANQNYAGLIDTNNQQFNGIKTFNNGIVSGTINASGNTTLGNTSGTVAIQGNNSTSAVTIQTASGTIGLGNNAAAQAIIIGNTTGATSIAESFGTGGYTLSGTGTIAIGGTSQTSAITLGQSTASNTISIGSSVTGSGNVQTINIGTSTGASSSTAVTIGSTVAGTTTLQSAGGTAFNYAGTANAATITATGNPASATNALLVINNNSTTPSGNIFDLQNKGVNKFSVDVNGNSTQLGGITAGTTGQFTVTGNNGNLTTTGQTTLGGATNQIQLVIKANSGQTVANPLLLGTDSSSNELFRLTATDNSTLFLGYKAGNANTGVNNVGIGSQALQGNTSGTKNTAIGTGSLTANTTGNSNTSIGFNSLVSNTTGSSNNAFGESTLFNTNTGSNNSGFGNGSLFNNTTGSYNTAVGTGSLFINNGGSYNTGIGYYAGANDVNGLFYSLNNLQNATAIGAYAQVQSNNTIVLGSVDNATKVGIGITVPNNTFSVSPVDSGANGTAKRNSNTTLNWVSGPQWTTAMIGDVVVFGDGTTNTVAAVPNATTVTLGTATSVTDASSTGYRFHKVGLQVANTGNVGVGTTAPSALFSVGAGSAFQVDNSGNVTSTGNASFGSSLTFSAASAATISSASGQNLNVQASNSLNLLAGTVNVGTSTATAINIGSTGAVTNVTSSATKIQASTGITMQSTTDNANALVATNSVGASIFGVDTTGSAGNLIANGGAEVGSPPTGYTFVNGASIATGTGSDAASGNQSVKVTTGTSTSASLLATFTTAPTPNAASPNYNVSFSMKWVSGGTAPVFNTLGTSGANFNVAYSPNSAATIFNCSNFGYTQAFTIGTWVKVTCTFKPDATSVSGAYLYIGQTDSGNSRVIDIDNISVTQQNTSGTQNVNDIRIGGATSQGLTLLTLDKYAGVPFTGSNPSLAGSMYFDTTSSKIQCYDGNNWGACGAAPNSNITLTPEYAGATLHGTGIGTLTSDFCANQASIGFVVGTLCNAGDARNFYQWSSAQASAQPYSIYVTYKLPSTFKAFVGGSTTLTGRVDSLSNANVSYQVFRSTSGSISSCTAATTVVGGSTGAINTWTPRAPTTDLTGCGFQAGDNVVFQINVSSQNAANAYVENLNFSFTNQ